MGMRRNERQPTVPSTPINVRFADYPASGTVTEVADGIFLEALDPDTLILPSHRKPFTNVHHRLCGPAAHHGARLNLILATAGAETSAGELIDVLFTPALDGHQLDFAVGEAIAHLNHLVALGYVTMVKDESCVHYRRTGGGNRQVMPALS